jgi:NAD(P)H dehydrogenase (quinone)
MSETLLVTGAAGHLGRGVITHLLGALRVAPSRVVAVTRDPAKIADLAARGVTVRAGDFDNPASLATAFRGAARLLLISTDAIDRPGRRLAQHKTAVEAAKAAGVKHVIYTSMTRPEDSVIPFAPDHLGTEQALAASGLGWTVLRNAWYFENLLLTLPTVLASGKWFTSSGDGRIPYLAREDCALAAAHALASAATESTRYDITGAEALTVADVAHTLSDVLKKPIDVVQVSDAELIKGMVAAGVPEPIAALLASFDANARLGKFDLVTGDVERLTAKRPQTLAAFLAASRNALLGQAA